MSEAYLGQVEIFAFPFAPKYWMACNGTLLGINQNAALFSLLGTMYGGNGVTTFALPDLRGRAPISFGSGYTQGQAAGEETHQLAIAELPQHNHMVQVDSQTPTASNKNVPDPTEILGITGGAASDGSALQINLYAAGSPSVQFDGRTIQTAGSSVPHENRMPTLVLNFCICVSGLFPPRN
jgi:microcystin-dependent protein